MPTANPFRPNAYLFRDPFADPFNTSVGGVGSYQSQIGPPGPGGEPPVNPFEEALNQPENYPPPGPGKELGKMPDPLDEGQVLDWQGFRYIAQERPITSAERFGLMLQGIPPGQIPQSVLVWSKPRPIPPGKTKFITRTDKVGNKFLTEYRLNPDGSLGEKIGGELQTAWGKPLAPPKPKESVTYYGQTFERPTKLNPATNEWETDYPALNSVRDNAFSDYQTKLTNEGKIETAKRAREKFEYDKAQDALKRARQERLDAEKRGQDAKNLRLQQEAIDRAERATNREAQQRATDQAHEAYMKGEAQKEANEAILRADMLAQRTALLETGRVPTSQLFQAAAQGERQPFNLSQLPGGKESVFRALIESGASLKEALSQVGLSPDLASTLARRGETVESGVIEVPRQLAPGPATDELRNLLPPGMPLEGLKVRPGTVLYEKLRQRGFRPSGQPLASSAPSLAALLGKGYNPMLDIGTLMATGNEQQAAIRTQQKLASAFSLAPDGGTTPSWRVQARAAQRGYAATPQELEAAQREEEGERTREFSEALALNPGGARSPMWQLQTKAAIRGSLPTPQELELAQRGEPETLAEILRARTRRRPFWQR